MTRVAVIDYGAGNLRSVGGALDRVGARWFFAGHPEALEDAAAILLPGVGSAGFAMRELERRGLVAALRSSTKPLLGICLGLQLLFERSEEEGGVRCLGLLPGYVGPLVGAPKLPHMGWNQVAVGAAHPLFTGLSPEQAWFYFAHSFGCFCPEELVLGLTAYGDEFVSAAALGPVWGVQFHPEKSAAAGLRMLSNAVAEWGLVDGRPTGTGDATRALPPLQSLPPS